MREEDFIRELGYLALANRLKRLSEVMMTSGRKLYKTLELDIEPSWYLIFMLLQKDTSLTVTEIAQKLKYSHPSIVKIISKMQQKDYVELQKDRDDGRKQRVTLSAKAMEKLPYFEQLWQAGERAMESLFDPGDTFLESLDQLDLRIQQKSFQERTLHALEHASYTLRAATPKDHDAIWEIFTAVVAPGDTYAIPKESQRDALSSYWLAPNMQTFVLEHEANILGTYILRPNQLGAGRHTANAAYMVAPDARRQGVGESMCIHSLQEARRSGYNAMQFNLVVSTNHAAIALWKKYAFKIIGTVPSGFEHPEHGFVDAFIMHRTL